MWFSETCPLPVGLVVGDGKRTGLLSNAFQRLTGTYAYCIYRPPNGLRWEPGPRSTHQQTWKLISASGAGGILKDLYHEWN